VIAGIALRRTVAGALDPAVRSSAACTIRTIRTIRTVDRRDGEWNTVVEHGG
jgi:hypothetical protein